MPTPFERFLPEIVAALLVGVAGVLSILIFFTRGDVTWLFAVIWGIATLGSVGLVPAVARSGEAWEKELRTLFIASLGIGVVSIVTGIGNNATDEPFTMGAYLSVLLHGQDPYTTTVYVSYSAHTLNLWSESISTGFHYVYLPLLLFFQIPGTGAVGYKSVCLACWVGIVYVLRREEFAALCLVSPVVALLAANGFSDLPAVFLVTLSLRGTTGTTSKVVEYVSLGMKQFANAFWLIYYILRREVIPAVLVVVVTFAIAAPFILWHPTGIWCEAITFSSGPGCSSAPNDQRHLSDLYSHWNYYLWILWVYALFHGTFHRWARRGWSRLHRIRPAAPASA